MNAKSGGRRPRLGRGLDAMLPKAPQPGAPTPMVARIEDVHPNRDQPRKNFDDGPLRELADSIKALGVLEPLLVRERKQGGYALIAGERRWRAAQLAGLREVPIFVRELSDKEAFEAALVENLQREELNPIETAHAFSRLLEEYGYTQEELAHRVGKDRSTISNALRLLKLPGEVLELVEEGTLSEGHGRALLGAPSPGAMRQLARRAVQKSWSVRETERQTRQKSSHESTGKKEDKPSANVRDLESRIAKSLGCVTRVVDRKGKGRLELHYASYDELDRLLTKLL